MTENIIELLLENAEKYPDKAAIIHKNKKITYRELVSELKSYASYFLSKGIKKGDGVLIFVPMSIELYKILSAVFYIGAAAVFVDAWSGKNRLDQALTIVSCSAFIGCTKAFILKLFSKKLRGTKINCISGLENFKGKLEPEIQKASKTDTALITFTTGSTGLPKAAKRTHDFLLQQHYVLKKHLKTSPEDIDLTSLPIFVLHNLACGSTSVIPDFNPQKPAEIIPEKIINDIKKNKITTSSGSPRFYEKLAEYGEIDGLKKIFTGGAPVFPKTAKKLKDSFKNTSIEIVYGSTEAEPISAVSADELIAFKGNISDGLFVGIPSEDIDVKIIKPTEEPVSESEFDSFLLPVGETGEICVEGSHVLKEYYNCDEAQNFAKIKYKGKIWHRTGDGGFLDKDEHLFLMGRIKNRFQYKGKDIYVFPIENSLLGIDEIEIGTVIEDNEKIHLIIELKKGADRGQAEKKIKEHGILFDEIIFIKKIPRDPRHNSKIDYDKLRLTLPK